MSRRITLDQYPHGIQEQIVKAIHPSECQEPCKNRSTQPAKVSIGAQVPPTRARAKGRVPRTRNDGQWTEAAFWCHLRSTLRRAYRFWKPGIAALNAARLPYRGIKGQKWAYLCADCQKIFRRKGVQIDHVEPVGELTRLEHIADFIRRLTPENITAYKIRCLKCHQAKTDSERTSRRKGNP